MKKAITGWAFSYNETKGHYFNNSIKSLCGKSVPLAYTIEPKVEAKDCCAKCLKEKNNLNRKG